MWKSLYHFNLQGEDELSSEGVHVHMQGLKGRAEKDIKTAFSGLKVEGDETSDGLKDTAIQLKWLDDDSAFAIMPETCRKAVAAMLESEGVANGIGGMKLTSFGDWAAACSAGEA